MVTITLGRPRISLSKNPAGEDQPDVLDRIDSIFTVRNFITLGAGIAIGIILKQQSDIRVLRKTVDLLQEAIR